MTVKAQFLTVRVTVEAQFLTVRVTVEAQFLTVTIRLKKLQIMLKEYRNQPFDHLDQRGIFNKLRVKRLKGDETRRKSECGKEKTAAVVCRTAVGGKLWQAREYRSQKKPLISTNGNYMEGCRRRRPTDGGQAMAGQGRLKTALREPQDKKVEGNKPQIFTNFH